MIVGSPNNWEPTPDEAKAYLQRWQYKSLRKLSRRRRKAISKRLVIAYRVVDGR